uniref:Uncharacterized protein n=1 Tax=Avena sativa TaxID=4498 RepID=A0ACD5TXR2_AVESA
MVRRRRGKVKLQYIKDLAMRSKSQKMRLANLMKKARELAVLCDVPVGVVVYVPGKDQPEEVWPSQEAATDVLVRYGAVEEPKRLKYKLDGDDFVRKTVVKSKANLYNAHRQNCEKEMNLLMVDFLAGHRGSFADLPPNVHASLEWRVKKKLQAVKARLQEIRGGAIQPPLPAQLQLVPLEPAQEDVLMVEPLAMVLPPSGTAAHVAVTIPLEPAAQEDVLMVEPLAMVLQPSGTPAHADFTLASLHEEASDDAFMTLDGEPRHGSYLFEVFKACDVAGDGSGLPTTEELHAVFVKAGIFTAPQPNPSFEDPM